MAKKSVNMNDYKTEDIDKLFKTVPKGLKMTGTGYNPAKKTTATKKKVKRKQGENLWH